MGFIACSEAPEQARAKTTDFQNDRIAERIMRVVKPQIGERNVGAVVGIHDHGALTFLTFGETSRGSASSPTVDTLFELGSVTKTFTGLMLAQSVELGRGSLTDTLGDSKREWQAQRVASINLLELLTHRSGLPRVPCDLRIIDADNPFADYTEAELVQGLLDTTLDAQSGCVLGAHPSDELLYSNWGHATLGYALSAARGETYAALLEELVTGPLELHDTGVTLTAAQRQRTAQGYNAGLEPTALRERQILFGSGAIRSSALDLMTYVQAYLHPGRTPLLAALRRASELVYSSPSSSKIGYAWFITPAGNLMHDGMTGGFASRVKIYLERDLAVFYLTNTARQLQCFIEAVEDLPCDPAP